MSATRILESNRVIEAKEAVARVFFGRSKNDGVCITCGSFRVLERDFRDALSRKEYRLSRMCQTCQDEFFDYTDAL